MENSSELSLFLENKNNLNKEQRKAVEDTALETLKLCHSPSDLEKNVTILCDGYVQSGKTMAFEAVIAAGKDSGYKLFIVLAGVSNPLLNQSIDRIEVDFRLKDPTLPRRWVRFVNPNDKHKYELSQAIDNIYDTTVLQPKAIIITVLKHSAHINKLAKILKEIILEAGQHVPTIIIDDEADQAGLNTRVQKVEKSTTYESINNLRNVLPSHSYLQYTATPQAPLLINTLDILSPDFIKLIEPGNGYTGGKQFFCKNSPYIKLINSDELIQIEEMPVPEKGEVLDYSNYQVPQSFLEALQTFIVGLAIEIKRKNKKLKGNRSMLIHPDRKTKKHTAFTQLTQYLIKSWKETLTLKDEKYNDLVDSLSDTLKGLQNTCDITFLNDDDLIQNVIYALSEIAVKEVNAVHGKTPEIDWSHHYAFILIGGMALDRGFTVEGLTVTYMPRGIGVGNIDSIQQRARFFGYKQSYLDICRIYLDDVNKKLYEDYVIHEEAIRKSLKDFSDSKRPLVEWKRVFWLNPSLQPCRKNVLNMESIALARSSRRSPWFYPNYIYGKPTRLLENNKILVQNFQDKNLFEAAYIHPRTGETLVSLCKLPLKKVHADLLVNYSYINAEDQVKYFGYLFQIEQIIEDDSEAECYIYHLTPNKSRIRTVQANGTSQTQKGESEQTKDYARGEILPAESKIAQKDIVTIHIADTDAYDVDEKIKLFEGIKVLSIKLPKHDGWYSQLEFEWN